MDSELILSSDSENSQNKIEISTGIFAISFGV